MWDKILKIGKDFVQDQVQGLTIAKDKALNEINYGVNEIKKGNAAPAGRAIHTATSGAFAPLTDAMYKLADGEEAVLGQIGQTVEKHTGIPSIATELLIGAAIPGAGEAKTLTRKATKAIINRVPAEAVYAAGRTPSPATLKKMKARDLLVDQNKPPVRGSVRPADFRGMSGDIQGGIKGKPIRMEGRPEYQSAATGLPIGQFNSNTPTPLTPHHRMGIQDNRAFFEGKTGAQAAERREQLAVGGLHPGNTGSNYEPMFDGIKSSKASKKTGIVSHDHNDVHLAADKLRRDWNVKPGSSIRDGKPVKNRSLDTFHGKPIKDMPDEQSLALQLQLGWADELAIDKVQGARFKAFQKKYGHLPYAERRKIILEQPEKFANLSTKE